MRQRASTARYYGKLFRRAGGILVHGYSAIFTVVAMVVAVALVVNESWVEKVKGWGDFSPWFGVLPIALLLLYGLLRANYEQIGLRDESIVTLEKRVAEVEALPVPVVRFLEGREQSAVLMQSGNVPIYQPFAWGAVANSKSLPDKGAVAKSARIELTVESLGGEVLIGPVFGRWRDAPAPAGLDPHQLHTNTEAIDLDPTEVPYEFDLGTKGQLEDAGWYAITARQWIQAVGKQEARVYVVLRGLNFADVKASYLVSTMPGLGFTVELEN